MARYGTYDYGTLAKSGFFLGLGMFALGAGGEIVGHALWGTLPGWEETLFFDLEVLGLIIGFVSPFLFGIALPLTE